MVQLGGAKEVLSQEIPGSREAAQQEGVLRALVRSRPAQEEHRVVWLEGSGHPLLYKVYQTLPLGSAEIRLGMFQRHAFLTTPPAPGCGLVLSLAKLCDLFW